MTSKSNPACSAATASETSSRGPRCSVMRVYPKATMDGDLSRSRRLLPFTRSGDAQSQVRPRTSRVDRGMATEHVDDELWTEFHRVVNMTSQELRDWLMTRSAGE